MCSVWQGLNPATLIAPLATMIAPAASGCARTCRFVTSQTAHAKPMHNKGSDETNSEGFSAHPELSRRSAAHVRRHPASSGRLCEALERILAVVQTDPTRSCCLCRHRHPPADHLRFKGCLSEPGSAGK